MRRSRHQNLFFYYRGPSSKAADSSTAERWFDQQLEDNATKALINLLEYSSPELTRAFLERFVGVDVGEPDSGGFTYTLQGALRGAAPVARRYLLGLSMLGTIEDDEGEGPGSRVDAALYRPDDLLVVFEVKIGGGVLGRAQLKRHAKKWKIGSSSKWKLAQWPDVYRWAQRELAERQHLDVTHFLLSQYVEFLEFIGLAPFAGFREDDFGFFISPSWEKQPEVKARLAALWQEVLKHLSDEERAALGEVHVGQLSFGTAAHSQTNWGESGVNLTTELEAAELQVNLVGWRQDDAERFEGWLLSDDGRHELTALRDDTLFVFCREAGNIAKRNLSGARPWFQRETVRELGRRPAPGVSRAWLVELLRSLGERRWEKPAFHLRRSFDKDHVVRRGEDIAGEVADEVRRLLPIMHNINGAEWASAMKGSVTVSR